VPDTDQLWGGILTSISFDPVSWTLRLAVEVLESEELHHFELVLGGVTQWHSSRGVPLPWNHAEVTEVHVVNAARKLTPFRRAGSKVNSFGRRNTVA